MRSKNKIISLNNYTLLESGKNDIIHFYPASAMLNVKVSDIKSEISVIFEISKYSQNLCSMYCSLLNEDGQKIFCSYSISLKEIEPNKYVVINNNTDIAHAEILPDLCIDFNSLDYNSFIDILKQNTELAKMTDKLTDLVKQSVIYLEQEQQFIKTIDLPSPLNYYQNVTGYIIDKLEELIANKDEISLSNKILKNIRKNYELVLYEENQIKLAETSLYATLLNNTRSKNFKPKNILEPKEIKTDTNKKELPIEELNYILKSYIKNLKEKKNITEDLNIIQERIAYIINSKPKVKEFTNFVKIILIADEYIDQTKRNRSIKEELLKDLIIKSFANQSYRQLPRNQILLYNQKDNIVDFICIITPDKILELLKTYRLNSEIENKENINLLKSLEELILTNNIKKTTHLIQIYILLIIMLNIYHYKTINNNSLLFEKGNYILNLDRIKGHLDIKVIKVETEKRFGHLIKLSQATEKHLSESLDQGEKFFNKEVNKIIYKNLENGLADYKIAINIKELSHKGITISLKRNSKEDIFIFDSSLYDLLIILTSFKRNINHKVEESNDVEKEELVIVDETFGLTEEEYNYILRKSNTINQIMHSKPINNPDYETVSSLYERFIKSNDMIEKQSIINDLVELLEKK